MGYCAGSGASLRVDAIDRRHLNIHQDHVWLECGRQGDGYFSRLRLADYLNVRRRARQCLDAMAEEG